VNGSRERARYIGQADVRRLLSMKECIDLMADTLAALSRGEAVQPVRSITAVPDRRGLLGLMPGFLGRGRLEPSLREGLLGVKAISVFPGNHGTPYDSHQGVVLLFEPEHGVLRAIVDATAVTAIRTAAVSAAATRALARTDVPAHDLAILGSGVQARAHLDAIGTVCALRSVRVWSRDPEAARRFAASRTSGRTPPVIGPEPTAEQAVRGASIVCTTTSSREPVLRGEWLAPGTHVNAVGACLPQARELDTESVRRATVFVDHRAAALVEAGDLLLPIQENAITTDSIAGEIGDVFAGKHAGRRHSDEITLFKSLGLAIEDLAAAAHVYNRALREDAGTPIDAAGLRA